MVLSIIEGYWNEAYIRFPYGDGLFFTLAIMISQEIIWIPYNLFLLWLHYKPNPYFEKWRIQIGKSPSKRLLRDCLSQMIVSHIIITPLFIYLVLWNILKILGISLATPFPSFSEMVIDFVVMFILNDSLFYFAHRLLHHPLLYKKFHAQHHRFITPIGISSQFASPLETIIANAFPTFAGALFMRSHLFTICLWFSFRILETIEAHSGYDFPFWFSNKIPFLHGPRGHDWHHSHNRGVYGMSKFWDWYCGTDVEYRQSK